MVTSDSPTTDRPTPAWHGYVAWIFVFLIIAAEAAVRVPFLSTPLDRDEGEFAYAGQLILAGEVPYRSLYAMKMPGIYVAYALIEAVFGQTDRGIHLGLLVVNAMSIVLVFLIGRALFDAMTGVFAAASFAIFSLNPLVECFAAQSEHFVMLAALAGVWLLLVGRQRGQLAWFSLAGAMFAIAVLMKQHGAAFAMFGAGYVLVTGYDASRTKRLVTELLALALGAAIPMLLTAAVLLYAGVFDAFWFWTIVYAREYVSSETLAGGWKLFRIEVYRQTADSLLLWGMAAIGLSATIWDAVALRRRAWLWGFALASFLAICPGLYFRSHYFIYLSPSVSLLVAVGLRAIGRQYSKKGSASLTVTVLLSAVVFSCAAWQQVRPLLRHTPNQLARMIYGGNPTEESVEIARYLADNTSPGDTIAVIGSEPQLFFYSGRRSATPHIYIYPLMGAHPFALEMQKQMIDDIERARPKMIVFVNVMTSWLKSADSYLVLEDWFVHYRAAHYEAVGLIDILPGKTQYYWGNDAAKHQPKSPHWLAVYRRRDG